MDEEAKESLKIGLTVALGIIGAIVVLGIASLLFAVFMGLMRWVCMYFGII